MSKDIEQAIKVFNQGGIVIFPTDTAFGIGCRMDNEPAVKRLFKIRQRPLNQPTPVLVNGFDMVNIYVTSFAPDVKDKLIDKYWPGALTIVFPCKTKLVPALVRGGGSTIGFRMPNQIELLAIITALKVPILGPSANFHGGKTPFDFKDLNKDLVKKVDFVLNGDTSLNQASTVIDVSVNPWQILRKGAIDITIS